MVQAASQLAITIIALLWSGMILGISFLESWVKFKASSLTKTVGLDVGRTVFRAFHKTQFMLLIMLIILSIVSHIRLWDWFVLALITLVFMLQNCWLFPMLSKRVDLMLAGSTIPRSKVHSLYGILEFTKLGLLLGLSIKLLII